MAKKIIVPKLSRRTGIAASTLYNILNGVRRPSWDKAEAMAAATNQGPGFFMGLKDLPPEARATALDKLELIPWRVWAGIEKGKQTQCSAYRI